MTIVQDVPVTMRAAVHDRHGDPKRVLRLAESQPVSAPRRGQVVVRAAFFPAPGAWTECVAAVDSVVVPVTDHVSDATAALMLVNTLTALMLLCAVDEAWAGAPRPFVQTAAGPSVARLVAAAAERHENPLVNLVRSTAGAVALSARSPSLTTIATSESDRRARLHASLAGAASVVLDPVGGTLATELLGTLEDGGSMVSYGELRTHHLVEDVQSGRARDEVPRSLDRPLEPAQPRSARRRCGLCAGDGAIVLRPVRRRGCPRPRGI